MPLRNAPKPPPRNIQLGSRIIKPAPVPPVTSGPAFAPLSQPAGNRATWVRPGHVQSTPIPTAQVVTATATLIGTGYLPGPAIAQGAGATPAGTGYLPAPAAVQGASAALTGTGSLTSSPGQAAALTGTGYLPGPAVVQGAVATVTGTGYLPGPGAVQGAGATLTGTGYLAANVTQGAGATLTGTGYLTAAPPATSGPVFAPLSQPAGGRVTWTRPGHVQATPIPYAQPSSGAATLTGTGYLTANVTQGAGAAPTGTGYLTAAGTAGGGGTPGPAFVRMSQPAGSRVIPVRAGHVQSLPGATVTVTPPGAATLTGAGVLLAGGTVTGTPGPAFARLAQPVGGRVTWTRPGHAQSTLVPSAQAGAPVSGAATLIGTGYLAANVTQGAGATLTGTGYLPAPAVMQGAGATLTGTGYLAANVTEGAGAALTGTGYLAASVTQGAGAAPTGTGYLPAPAVMQGAGAAPTGTGYLPAPAAVQRAGAAPTGTGYLAASAAGPLHSGPFAIMLPGGWARNRYGPLPIPLAVPAVSLAGFSGTRATISVRLLTPKTTITGTVKHQPFQVVIPKTRTTLAGTVKHQPLNLTVPKLRTTITGTVKHQPLQIVIPKPRTALAGTLRHQPLNLTLPKPRTAITGTLRHQPLQVVVPKPRVALAGTRSKAGTFNIQFGLFRMLHRVTATPEELAAWQGAQPAQLPGQGYESSHAAVLPPSSRPGTSVRESSKRGPGGVS